MKLRTSLAAVLLGLTVVGLAFEATRYVLAARALHALPSLAIGGAYLAIAIGVLRGSAWARWLGFGVALSGTLLALIGGGIPLPGWLVLALHAPLPLLLARPDDAHPRTAVSLLLVGAALVPVLGLAASALHALAYGADLSRWALVLGGALGVAGTLALARERTWGLLTVGLAGACLFGAYLAMPAHSCGCASSSAASASRDLVAIGSIVLLAAALPFAGPVARFLRR